MSSGKSTLLNELLERHCVAEDVRGSTTVPVHIAGPDSEHPHGTVRLEARSPEQHWSILKWLLPMELDTALNPTALSQASARWTEELAATTPEATATLIRRLFELQEEVPEPPQPVLSELGCGDAMMRLDPLVWQRVVVFLDSPWAKSGVEWIDLPGLGHVNPLHRWMTEQVLATADRSFLLVEPRGATETILDVLAGMDSRTRDSMTLVFSRVDETAAHGEDWQAASAKVVEQIGWDGRWPGVSALCARAARRAQQISPGQRELRNLERLALQQEPLSPSANLDLSGILGLKAILRDWAGEHARAALRNDIRDLDASIQRLERELEERHEARRSEVMRRYSETLHSAVERLRRQESASAQTLRGRLRQTVAAERVAFAQLDRAVQLSERRQWQWIRRLSWNVQYKTAVADVLRGLGERFAGGLTVLLNAALAPHGPSSARSPRHAKDLVNLRKAADTLSTVDQLFQCGFLADREARLGGLSPIRRWTARLGFPGPLRAEAYDYVAELGRQRAVVEQELLRKEAALSGLGLWRTPLRRDLAGRRRRVSAALALIVERQAIPAVRELATSAQDDLEALRRMSAELFHALDSEADRALIEQLGALRASLEHAQAMLKEHET
jgi:hypothetical protein